MKGSVVASLLIGTVLLGLAACASTEDGQAQASSTDRTPNRSTSVPITSGSLSESIDPCTLFEPESDLDERGRFREAEEKTLGAARVCRWQRERENPTDDGLVVSLNVWDEYGISDVNDVGGGIQNADVNGRPVARAANPATGDCTIALELSNSSRIDVGVSALSEVNESCQIAQDVAYIVEPRLPQA